MPLELLIKLAARIRRLTPNEFAAMEKLISTGDENVPHLDAVTTCLADLIVISGRHEQPKPHTLKYVDGW